MNPNSPKNSPMKNPNPKSPFKSPLKNPKSPSSSNLSICKSPYKSPYKSPCSSNLGFNDGNPRSESLKFDYYEDSTSVETDPKWGRELDSEGEPIYTPDPYDWENHEYTYVDAVFSNTDCEEEQWLDKLGPFSSEFLFLWVHVVFD
jgi:hypothetical protein